MSIIGSNILAGASGQAGGGGAYEISRSVRFNSADSAYLSRTPASAGNRRTWTWAGWVKRSELGNQTIFEASPGGDFYTLFWFTSSDQIQLLGDEGAGPVTIGETSAAVFRDVSAWMHVLLAVDTSQASASSRVRLYINGIEATLTKSLSPSLNYDTYVNSANAHAIAGGARAGMPYFSGYLADIHFIDGQALDPSSFGEFDTNGVWQPIDASELTYGTNGFHLPFSDNSTAAALGTDTSSNGNDWTVNNISVTAGAGNDSLVDSPTNGSQTDTGVGGEVVGNYATLNPLDNDGNSLTNGNLELAGSGNNYRYTRSSIYVASGKWYWECLISATGGQTVTGPQILRASDTLGAHSTGNIRGYIIIYDYIGTIYVLSNPNGSNTTLYSTSGSLPAGTIVGIALDATNGKLWISVNGTWLNSGNPDTDSNPVATGLTGPYTPGGWAYYSSDLLVYNFGQRPFAYSSNHTSFKALCTANLPEPTIADGSTVMDVALYTGNGSTQTISGLNFSPDLVWIKYRNSGTYGHVLFDQIRGATNWLSSNSTIAEFTDTNSLTTFNSSGFALGAASTVNENTGTYAAWTWDAGSSTVTNTEGSITSQVRANASAGFSVMTGSTPASSVNFTFGHNLGIAPSLVIYKHTAVSGNWQVYHRSGGGNNYNLNSTAGPANSGTWSGLDPSSTLITIPSGIVSANSSAFVCYAWAPVSGYSSFGSYTGNGSADGPFVYTGHRVKYLMVKRTDSTGDWFILDGVREPYNYVSRQLGANNSGAESGPDAYNVDFTANGFKLRNSIAGFNASAGSYAYIAFAESPFQYARAR